MKEGPYYDDGIKILKDPPVDDSEDLNGKNGPIELLLGFDEICGELTHKEITMINDHHAQVELDQQRARWHVKNAVSLN